MLHAYTTCVWTDGGIIEFEIFPIRTDTAAIFTPRIHAHAFFDMAFVKFITKEFGNEAIDRI